MSDAILTAVIQGLRPEQQNNEIRYAGGRALYSILEFIKNNFQKDNERNFIMKTICEATLSQDQRVRKVAMECIVKIAFLYYDRLKDYMDALYQITVKAAKTDAEEVALQAIEFWSTIAEIETEILEEAEYIRENDIEDKKPRHCFKFIHSALKPLIGLLTEILVNQNEDQSDDEWNKSTAAGTCLALVAKVTGDDVVLATMPFISANINSQNWKFREAATLAFSAILDGPTSKDKMKGLVNQALPFMLNHVTDSQVLVRDTTVFTLGRIAKFHFSALLENNIDNVIKATLHSLKDEPRVAAKAAWAIHNIAEALEQTGASEQPSNLLSQYFQALVQTLLQASIREDEENTNLRTNTYAALSTLISCAATDVYAYLETIIQMLMQRLGETLKQQGVSASDREEINTIQGLLCTTLQSLTNKLGPNIKKYASPLMQLYLSIFQSKNTVLHEETFMAIGALAQALQHDFEPYLQAFKPFLLAGLKNKADEHICKVALNVVGDLCVALGDRVYPICDDIVTILLTHLQDPNVSRTIKPDFIASFGDIALAIEGLFEKYLKYVAVVLKKASEAQVDPRKEDMVEYLNVLRENIFEAYTGILQGLKKKNPQAFTPYVDDLVNFICLISQDETVDEVVFKSAVSVIGDLANVYGSKIKPWLSKEQIVRMVEDALGSQDKETKETAKWVEKQLKKIGVTLNQ
jgi:importin subunit beta-1